jgi:Zn-dependent peptidase ImmA (M78 family)
MHVAKMSVAYQRDSPAFIPEIDRDDFNGRKSGGRLDIEDVARLVREMWMLPKGPIENMVELLESKHCIVIPCDFGTDLIDAMSQRIDGYPVLFFININAPADRIRHTLAHELGHMVLHTSSVKSDDEMEDEADAFAGAFLLPADEIRPQLRRFDLRQLANMKAYWKVSMAAIAVRADRLNLITPYQKKVFWVEMGKLGYRKREPNEPPRELPATLKRMVDFHRGKLGYSAAEMAKLLELLPAEYASMYGAETFGTTQDPRRRLRIVK